MEAQQYGSYNSHPQRLEAEIISLAEKIEKSFFRGG